MQPVIELIPFDGEREQHLRTLFSVRSHPDVALYLRGPPPANYSDHVRYLQNLGKHKRFFLIQWEVSLCGYCQLTQGENSIEIGMALHPDFCNRGIGTQALSKLLSYLQNEEEKRWILFVKKDNVRAIALYRKFGFVEKGESLYGEYRMERRK